MNENDKITDDSEENCNETDCCQESAENYSAEQSAAPDLAEQLRQAQEQVLRVLADYDNFKKRSLKERSELLKYQGERIFQDLLEVVDNFELALNFQDCDAEQMRKGMELIHKNFQAILEKWEVKGVSAVGEVFDPNAYNAISTAPAAGDIPAGSVVAELKKAYFYKDKLLRPGDVIVAV